MPHAPYSSIIGIPLVEPVIRRTLGIIRRKDAVLSPAAERFFALLINLWTDDKDNLWTNIVERQRHALQEIGYTPAQERLRRLNQRLVRVDHYPHWPLPNRIAAFFMQ